MTAVGSASPFGAAGVGPSMRWRSRPAHEERNPALTLVPDVRTDPRPPRATPLANRLGLNLRRVRLARGWSEAELADAVGLPETLLINVENGRAFLPRYLVARIAECLSVDAAELHHGPPDPHQDARR